MTPNIDRAALVEKVAKAICCPAGCGKERGILGFCHYEGHLSTATATIATYEAHMEQSGMMMVPMEPTGKMLDAGMAAGMVPLKMYRAMLAAAKQEEQQT